MIRTFTQIWHVIETYLGALFCWFVGFFSFGIAIGPAVVSFMRPQWQVNGWAVTALATVPLAIACCIVNIWLFSTTYDSLGEPGVLGINAAQRMPRWPRWFRPFAALWWMLLFLAGVWVALRLEYDSYGTDVAPTWYKPHGPLNHQTPVWAFMILGFGMTFAGNTFLLLCVGAFNREPTFLMRFWRHRLLLDMGVMVLAGIAAYGGFFRRQ